MAKTKKDTDGMSKTELKAHHKEINEYFEQNGWRDTLSHFSLSPKQASEITAKTRARMEKEAEKAKAAKKKAKAESKKEKAKAPKKTSKKTTVKKRGRPKKSESAAVEEKHGDVNVAAVTLDYLLSYRVSNSDSIDEVIVKLARQVRGV